MTLYATINRYRGTKSKALGCLLMALPAVLVSGLGWGYFWHSTGTFTPFLYVLVANILSAFICLMWWHNSDDWRNPRKMAKQWFWKGGLSFLLLGNPFGFMLSRLKDAYAENFTATKEDKAAVERAEGEAWGEQSFLTALVHLIVALILARLL